jgi:2-polyprenyl-3-methyl-5-hydroxy-6-metoxy-1,4-benzoquinol methylase
METTSTELLPSAYDQAASFWRRKIETLGYAHAYRWVLEEIGIKPAGKTVLDAGCGTGDFARAFLEVGGTPRHLTLLDPSSEMLSYAKNSLVFAVPELSTVCAGLEAETNNKYDIIICAHVIEHFEDPSNAISHLKEMLNPDGQLLLVVSKPHWCNWIIWVRWRHRMYRPAVIQSFAQKLGLDCIWNAGFPAGPPSRSSHAYLLTHQRKTK